MSDQETPPPATEPVDIGGWPTWLRRTLIVTALLFGLGVAAWGSQKAVSGGDDPDMNSAIVSLTPANGAQALRQTAVGADLTPGYDGRLVINGITIPEEQMEGARDPATLTPKELADEGVRPNNRNTVYFKPGPGKVITEFDTGTVRVSMTYFKDKLQNTTSNTVNWEFRVS